MEKIQEAIAKARQMREAQMQGQPAPAATAEPPVAPVAQPAPAAPAPAEPLAAPPPLRLDRAQSWSALPELQIAPRRLRRNRILTGQGGKDSADFDMIRTRILQAQRANGWKRIAITSPGPSSGKSTLALNLAFSFARQPEQFTLLAEVDLRRPSIAKTLGIKRGYNFAAVLGGAEAFEDNCFRCGPNLVIAPNDSPARNPAELLQSDRSTRALDDIEARFQPTVTLFDMPPLLAGDDAMGFLPKVDAAILVAAAEQTTLKQIDICERDIASQTNVLGIVLNKCRYMDRDRSYGYDYY